jgi:hypothetical protein
MDKRTTQLLSFLSLPLSAKNKRKTIERTVSREMFYKFYPIKEDEIGI